MAARHLIVDVDQVPGTVLVEVTAVYDGVQGRHQSMTYQGEYGLPLVRQAVNELLDFIEKSGLDIRPFTVGGV